ncbi:MAG: SIR2 family protein [Burkholderiales bacterium]
MSQFTSQLQEIRMALAAGTLIPYLGPGLLELVPDCPVPDGPDKLAVFMSAKVSVPHKIRQRVTAVAQFIENFKHRKTLVDLMRQAFGADVAPTRLQQALATLPAVPLIVSAWYDDAMQNALSAQAAPADWGRVQGLSQAEHFGTWFQFYDAAGQAVAEEAADSWKTVLYQPIGARAPAANYLVSDSDYVEVLTEIDIQTPIPPLVQSLRRGRHFLFVGCRFNDQLQRTFARQIIKRSSDRHWAVLQGQPSRNEQRFMAEYGIEQIDIPLADFESALTADLLVAA